MPPVASSLAAFVGRWTGEQTLVFDPTGQQRFRSRTEVVVTQPAGAAVLHVQQTWSHESRTHTGVLLAAVGDDDRATGGWVDTWHQPAAVMTLAGTRDRGTGTLTLEGSYGGGDGPPWGWRIALERPADDALALTMTNIAPDGQEARAVDARYERA